MDAPKLRVAKDVKAPMPASEPEMEKAQEKLQSEISEMAKGADDPAFEKELLEGAEKGRKIIAAELEAADWSVKIGRRLKLVSATEIEIERVERGGGGSFYNIEFRERHTGKRGKGSLATEEFLTLEKTPPALGKWLRRFVNAALGERLDR